MAEVETKVEDKLIKISPERIKPAEYERTTYIATVEPHTTLAQMQEPSFWSLYAAKLRPYDMIEVRCDDGSFWAEFLVLACDRTWAKVYKLRFEKLTTSDVSLSQADKYELRFRGPHKKWSVIRKSDEAIIREEMSTKEEAQTYLREYQQTVDKVT